MTIDPTYTRESLEKNPRHNKNSIKSNKSLDDNESNLAELSDIGKYCQMCFSMTQKLYNLPYNSSKFCSSIFILI